jgi:hypothetical protein
MALFECRIVTVSEAGTQSVEALACLWCCDSRIYFLPLFLISPESTSQVLPLMLAAASADTTISYDQARPKCLTFTATWYKSYGTRYRSSSIHAEFETPDTVFAFMVGGWAFDSLRY